MNSYLRSFVIGSSLLVVLPFLLRVATLRDKNYSYESYSILAPLYFGLMNMLSLCISNNFNLTLRQRYVTIGLISPIIVISFAKILGTYTFSTKEWVLYCLRIMVFHFLTYNISIYLLESYVP